MIIKSMSRKQPSFDQLITYIDRDGGQDAFTMRQNLFARDTASICAEFERNAAFLRARKNGVYLFHEILSITRAEKLSPEEQKRRLYEIAQEYIRARCPGNLVYGGLHQDKDHSYHMHLMISANEVGQEKRQRLTKRQFREIQVRLEAHVLETYPELEQTLSIGKRSERKRSQGEIELERRTGKRPKREEVLEKLRAAFAAAQDRDSFLSALGREGLDLYARGQTLGVIDLESGKKHRLKTLDLELAEQVATLCAEPVIERDDAREQARDAQSEPEREAEAQAKADRDTQSQADRAADPNPKTPEQENDMSRDGPVPPDPERRELIDKGHIKPDPERDLLTHKEWKDQDKFLTKVQQSWRRTLDDFRGRTEDLEKKAQKDRDREQ